MKRGFTVRDNIGIGDTVQFTSLPENYYRATGDTLVDVSKCWAFDHNPYVERDVPADKITELWNFGPQQYEWPKPRKEGVYLSNAEIWASAFDVPVVQNRPRLYYSENALFQKRKDILIHCHGKSHGCLPDHVTKHIIDKYKGTGCLHQIGLDNEPKLGIPVIKTDTLWDLVKAISGCRMLIGIDSGPAWLAACYPDVIVKKIRMLKVHGQRDLQDWIPLEIQNVHSHWDDRLFQVYNATEEDMGFTQSYRKL